MWRRRISLSYLRTRAQVPAGIRLGQAWVHHDDIISSSLRLHVRHSSSQDNQPQKGKSGAAPSWLEKLSFERGGMGQGLVLGCGALALYGVSSALLDTVYTFMSLKPVEMGLYGYYAGGASALLGSGGAWWVQRTVTVVPDPIYRLAFKAVYKHTEASRSLGGGRIKNVGELKAYKTEGGSFKVGEKGKIVWSPPRAFLIFRVEGNGGEGVVVAEGIRKGFKTELTYARLDTDTARILIKGSTDRNEKLDSLAATVTFRGVVPPGR